VGQELDVVDRSHPHRVYYRNAAGRGASIDPEWTTLAAVDPVAVLSAGRADFRFADLLELAAQLSSLA
jgi:hypothetical protein